MEQEEPVGVSGAEPQVQIEDALARPPPESAPSSSRVGRRRVGEVAEDGEMDARIEVAEREHLQVLQQRGDAVGAGQQRRAR